MVLRHECARGNDAISRLVHTAAYERNVHMQIMDRRSAMTTPRTMATRLRVAEKRDVCVGVYGR